MEQSEVQKALYQLLVDEDKETKGGKYPTNHTELYEEDSCLASVIVQDLELGYGVTKETSTGWEFKTKETYGGEGLGEEHWCVISVTNPQGEQALIRFDGWYASYHGADYDNDFYFVKEEQVQKTVYVSVG